MKGAMTTARTIAVRLHGNASFEVLRMAMVIGCAAALALAGVSLRV